jgi:hypothetical protein
MTVDCRTTIVEVFHGFEVLGKKINDLKPKLPLQSCLKNTPKVVKLLL